jgi:hypothetical protein
VPYPPGRHPRACGGRLPRTNDRHTTRLARPLRPPVRSVGVHGCGDPYPLVPGPATYGGKRRLSLHMTAAAALCGRRPCDSNSAHRSRSRLPSRRRAHPATARRAGDQVLGRAAGPAACCRCEGDERILRTRTVTTVLPALSKRSSTTRAGERARTGEQWRRKPIELLRRRQKNTYRNRVPLQRWRSLAPSVEPCERFSPDGT